MRNRDWHIATTDDLKDALAYIVQHKPQFVMVSIDHPNNKVRTLPKVLTQAFPVCVIVFAENNTAASYRMMANSGCEYMINPPVTGPAVERTVNKYYKDLAAKNNLDTDAGKAKASNDASDSSISIKGASAGGMVSIKGGESALSAEGILAQLMKDEGDGAGFNHAGGPQSPAYNPTQTKSDSSFENSFPSGDGREDDGFNGFQTGNHGSSSSSSGLGSPGTHSSEGSGFSGIGGSAGGYGGSGSSGSSGMSGPGSSANGIPGSTYNPYEGRSGGPNSAFYNPQNYDSSNPSSPTESGFLNNGKPISPLAGALTDGMTGPQQPGSTDGASENGGAGNLNRRKKENKGHWAPQDVAEKDSTESTSSVYKRDPSQNDSIILKGTKEALEKSVISSKHKTKVQKIEESSNVACIIVESARFSGYLVTALGKNRKIDATFLAGVHERLFKFLRTNGEDVKNEEAMDIKIKEVPFEDWAMDCAEFLRKSVHDGDEVAMAFFPYANAKAELHESANSEMAAVNIEDLDGDRPVEFNLYIYLPVNKKYVLYTPRGGKFYGNQKEKLMRQGIKQMHLLKIEGEDMNKYRAQNYLNDKIIDFENRKKAKGA